ncbi:MAG: hypothetical protein WBC22_15380 [Sedimentisphaerales bacterium]
MNDNLGDLISKEQWRGYSSDEREWLTFNYLESIDRRLKKLETRKRFDTGISAIAGVIGGGVAFFASKIKFGG